MKITRDLYLVKNQIDENKIKKIENHVKSYLPGGFRALINIKSKNGEIG